MRALLGLSLLVLSLGCSSKPSEDECKKAIANMQRIYKYDAAAREAETLAFVRKCRARSSRKSVDCLINANTEAEVDACNASER